jgi:hypothetical protein
MVVGSGDREEQHVYLETVVVITVGSGDREEQHIYLETVIAVITVGSGDREEQHVYHLIKQNLYRRSQCEINVRENGTENQENRVEEWKRSFTL